MNTYKASVRVPAPNGVSTMVTWAQVTASSPITAKSLLESQYGHGNVIGVPSLVK